MLHWGVVLWLNHIRPVDGSNEGGSGGVGSGGGKVDGVGAGFAGGGKATGPGLGPHQGQGLGPHVMNPTGYHQRQGLGTIVGGSSLFETTLVELSQHHFSGSIRSGRAMVNGVRQLARQGHGAPPSLWRNFCAVSVVGGCSGGGVFGATPSGGDGGENDISSSSSSTSPSSSSSSSSRWLSNDCRLGSITGLLRYLEGTVPPHSSSFTVLPPINHPLILTHPLIPTTSHTITPSHITPPLIIRLHTQ